MISAPSLSVRPFVLCVFLAAASAIAAPARAATKVACVGDSITRGVGGTGGGYPALLGQMLGPSWQVGRFGNSGSTLMKKPADSYWVAPEFTAAKEFLPDVVVIMLGTNDAKGSWTSADGPHNYEPDYRAFIDEFAALASKPKIFLVNPPPMLRPSLVTANKVLETEVIPTIARIGKDRGLGVIKVHEAFFPTPSRYFGSGDGSDLGDGLHPNQPGHTLIAHAVFCAVTGARCAGPPPVNDGSADAADVRDAAVDQIGMTGKDAIADLGAEGDVGPRGDAVAIGAEVGGEAGGGAGGEMVAGSSGGAQGAAGSGGALASGGRSGRPPPRPDEVPPAGPSAGCSCDLGRTGLPPAGGLLALAVATLGARGRGTRGPRR